MDMFEMVDKNTARIFVPYHVIYSHSVDLQLYVRMRGIVKYLHVEQAAEMGIWVYGEINPCFLDTDL